MTHRAETFERVIVITGASAGIGRAAARAFARPGARIALLARGRDGLEGVRREVEAAGAEAMALQVDVADPSQVERAADAVESRWGGIDVWVNDAMTTVFGPVSELTPAELGRVTEVTYLGAAFGTLAALSRMRKRNRGVIVQVGSALAYRAIPLQAAYCGAKHALRGFSDAVRCELLHEGSGVHITSVHLAAFNTPQFDWARNHMPQQPQPVGPVFAPELAGRAIEWASRQRRREVFVGMPSLMAVLANKFAPGILDRRMADRAWEGQLSGEPRRAGGDNLFEPCAGDHEARGRFAARERKTSMQFVMTRHRAILLAGLAAAAALLAAAVLA